MNSKTSHIFLHSRVGSAVFSARAAILLLVALLTNSTAWADTVETFYLDASGTRHDVTATVLDGTETDLAEGTYIATGTLNYTNTTTDNNKTFALRLTGNVTLILEDGCTMNIGTSENRIKGRSISYSNNATLTICGQSTGNDMGTLSCYNNHMINACIIAYEITINGGNVIADADGEQSAALFSNYNDYKDAFTINGGNVTARANGTDANAIFANGNFVFNGGTLTTSTNGGYAIYSSTGKYTFTWCNPRDRITISSGGLYAYYDYATATFNKLFSSDTDYYGGTLTGDDINTALAGKTITAYAVPYLDENGDTQTCSDYKLLTETTEGITSAPGWRVAYGTLNFTNSLRLGTDVNLILMDGCQMNFGTSDSRLNKSGINIITKNPSLTIYGQTQGSGTLSIYNTGDSKNGISLDAITIYGGNVIVDSEGTSAKALYAKAGNVTINGGSVSATGGAQGIVASGNITLGWRNNTDRITASSYSAGSTVKVADGKTFYDGLGNSYSGDITDPSVIAGKTLRPYIALADNASNTDIITAQTGNTIAVALQGRTLYKDGAWNTLCLPFDVDLTDTKSPLYGATVKKLIASTSGVSGSTLTLNFEDETTTMTAGTPYIIKWTRANDYEDDDAHNLVNPVFTAVTISKTVNNVTSVDGKVTFVGSFSPVNFEANDQSILFLGAENKLYWPNANMTLGACRAHFELSDGAGVREFKLNFGEGETTRITTTNCTDFTDKAGAWYDMQGRKVSKPTKKGLYIHKGSKVVIK